jgi:hypothetical protein
MAAWMAPTRGRRLPSCRRSQFPPHDPLVRRRLRPNPEAWQPVTCSACPPRNRSVPVTVWPHPIRVGHERARAAESHVESLI